MYTDYFQMLSEVTIKGKLVKEILEEIVYSNLNLPRLSSRQEARWIQGVKISTILSYVNKYDKSAKAGKKCEALTNKTAFEELYKGCYNRIICTEEICKYSDLERLVEEKFKGEKTGYICPSPTGLIDEVVERKPIDKKTFLWIK